VRSTRLPLSIAYGSLIVEDIGINCVDKGLESITMVLVEIRRGRSPDVRLELGRRIVDICAEVLGVPKRTVLVEFTVHTGDEMLRDGDWAGEWTVAEASAGKPDTFVQTARTS
jgi:hypothetical protein